MAKFGINDYYEDDSLPATLYRIELGITDLELSEYDNIRHILMYYQKKEQYNHVSWFIGFSDTDSKTVRRKTERNGKRGRPRTIIRGDKVESHIHIGVIGDKPFTGSARDYSIRVCDAIIKNAHKTTGVIRDTDLIAIAKSIGRKGHAINYIQYCYRQSKKFNTGGAFDFSKYYEYDPRRIIRD